MKSAANTFYEDDVVNAPSSSLAILKNFRSFKSRTPYVFALSDYVNIVSDSSPYLKESIIDHERNDYENIFNEARVDKLKKEYTGRLIRLLNDEYFEYGYENECDHLVKEQMGINALATKEWLNTIFIENFDDPTIAIGILRLIARFDHDVISPHGITMVIAGLSHSDIEVRECCIRAVESWKSIQHLHILKSIETGEKWLNDYRDSVIKYIQI